MAKLSAENNTTNISDKKQVTATDISVGTEPKRAQDIAVINGISFASSALDSFGRLRVSNPKDILNLKNVYNANGLQMKKKLVGGAAITHSPVTSSQVLSVTAADGDRAVLQSRHVPYIPAKGQQIFVTGVIGYEPKPNSVRRIGYYDDLNGIFFEQHGTDLYIVKRSSVTGSVVDTRVIQTDWDCDTLDGNGPSGFTIDTTRAQIFEIDFQWLGVGKVRVGIASNDGSITAVHEFRHANDVTDVYMQTPTLPLRAEILNDGAASGASEIKVICGSVISEGAQTISGLGFHQTNSILTPRVSATVAPGPIFAIRLKSVMDTKPNRILAKLAKWGGFAEDQSCGFRVLKYHEPTSITATWTDADAYSGIEYSTDISAISGGDISSIDCTVITASNPANKANPGGADLAADTNNEQMILSQNIDSDNSEVMVIECVSGTGVATNVVASMTWLETS